MNNEQQELLKFMEAFELARQLYAEEGNECFNRDTWTDAQNIVLEATGRCSESDFLNYATVSYLLLVAISRAYSSTEPIPWVLDMFPHLLVQLRMEGN